MRMHVIKHELVVVYCAGKATKKRLHFGSLMRLPAAYLQEGERRAGPCCLNETHICIWHSILQSVCSAYMQ